MDSPLAAHVRLYQASVRGHRLGNLLEQAISLRLAAICRVDREVDVLAEALDEPEGLGERLVPPFRTTPPGNPSAEAQRTRVTQ
jgi:hypothetical protein